jgi:hypothetical protein
MSSAATTFAVTSRPNEIGRVRHAACGPTSGSAITNEPESHHVSTTSIPTSHTIAWPVSFHVSKLCAAPSASHQPIPNFANVTATSSATVQRSRRTSLPRSS